MLTANKIIMAYTGVAIVYTQRTIHFCFIFNVVKKLILYRILRH